MTHTINTRIVTVTPDMAEEFLAMNVHNRNVSRQNFTQLTETMRRGEWKLNGEAIKLDTNGRVLDGQHRLHACVESGVPFETVLIENLPSETQETMDTGKSRRLADVLALRGYPSANRLAALLIGLVRLQKYGLKQAMSSTRGGYPVTNKQATDRIEREPSIQEVVKFSSKFNSIGLPGRAAGVLYYVFSSLDSDDAEYFFEKLLTSESLDRGNPILTLRKALISIKSSRGTANQTYVAAIVIKAWNKFRAGETCLSLGYRPGGANPEHFPEPK